VESRGDDDPGWREVLTCLPELSVSPTIRHLERVVGMTKE
jgi:hypothetical protein